MLLYRSAFCHFVLVLLLAPGVHGQQPQGLDAAYSTKQLIIAPSITRSIFSADEFGIEAETGSGGGFAIGYGFSERFALLMRLSGAEMRTKAENDAYTLAHLDIVVRGTIGPLSSRWKGLLELMVSGITAENSFPRPDTELNGRMYSIGAGIQFFVIPEIALQAYGTTGIGSFNLYKLGDEEIGLDTINRRFATTRLSLTLVWYALR